MTDEAELPDADEGMEPMPPLDADEGLVDEPPEDDDAESSGGEG